MIFSLYTLIGKYRQAILRINKLLQKNMQVDIYVIADGVKAD